jgi:hypothetical protein
LLLHKPLPDKRPSEMLSLPIHSHKPAEPFALIFPLPLPVQEIAPDSNPENEPDTVPSAETLIENVPLTETPITSPFHSPERAPLYTAVLPSSATATLLKRYNEQNNYRFNNMLDTGQSEYLIYS